MSASNSDEPNGFRQANTSGISKPETIEFKLSQNLQADVSQVKPSADDQPKDSGPNRAKTIASTVEDSEKPELETDSAPPKRAEPFNISKNLDSIAQLSQDGRIN